MSEAGRSAEHADGFDSRGVADAWQGFIEQRPFVHAPVRDFVFESWQRCYAHGVDPHGRHPPASGDETALRARLQSNRELMTAAAHTWQLLSPTLANSDIVFVLADADAVVLDVKGNAELVTAAAQRGTAAGYDWSERASGTNALGTAVIRGRPTVIRSAEHYCAFAKIWDCAASPVRDLSDGSLLGVLDVTSMGNLSEGHSLALAVTAAHQIEHSLHSQELARTVQLLSWYRATSAKWKDQAVLLLDRKGRVITASEKAQGLCNIAALKIAVGVEGPLTLEDQAVRITQATAAQAPADHREASSAKAWSGGVVTIAVAPGQENRGPLSTTLNGMESDRPSAFKLLTTRDGRLLEVMRRADRMARANAPILLNGETGTGKELFARAIHACSNVASGPFVAINCGLLTKELAASELLGYEAGAFTGASSKGRRGKFELASGGTLFLDEIGELPLDVQVHLLRVLQDQVVVRMGGNDERLVQVRIIAATHRDLEQECADGRFRADLYFRLKILALHLPPLRERVDDIGPLADQFLMELQGIYGLGAKTVAPSLLDTLINYPWPGNVRELHGLIESMYILCDRPVLTTDDLPESFPRTQVRLVDSLAPRGADVAPLELERETIVEEIARQSRNMSEVARRLGISRSTLYRKLAQFGIERD